jgi:hypothetical protein
MGKPFQKRLVVARYKEDTNWTKDIPADWQAIIIQKQTEDLPGDIPNAGREPASFFYAVAINYDDIKPDDLWGFVQGAPFDHCPNFMDKLYQEPDGYTPLGGHSTKTADGTGMPTHPNLPLAEKYQEWLARPFPGSVEFTPGGQFMVRGRDLLKHPKEWYVKLMDDVTPAYNAYIAERLWAEMFKDAE